jgi:hypothetical protein
MLDTHEENFQIPGFDNQVRKEGLCFCVASWEC